MTSVASSFRTLAMGIIMTGLGFDRAQGRKAVRRHGGMTVGPDENSSAVYGMPPACAQLEILQGIAPLTDLPRQILRAPQ